MCKMRDAAFDVVSIPARMKVLQDVGAVNIAAPRLYLRTYDICATSSSSESFSFASADMFAFTERLLVIDEYQKRPVHT